MSRKIHPEVFHNAVLLLVVLVVIAGARGMVIFPGKFWDILGLALVFIGGIATSLGAAIPDKAQHSLVNMVKTLRDNAANLRESYDPENMRLTMQGVADALENLTSASSMARLGLAATALGSGALLYGLFQ